MLVKAPPATHFSRSVMPALWSPSSIGEETQFQKNITQRGEKSYLNAQEPYYFIVLHVSGSPCVLPRLCQPTEDVDQNADYM